MKKTLLAFVLLISGVLNAKAQLSLGEADKFFGEKYQILNNALSEKKYDQAEHAALEMLSVFNDLNKAGRDKFQPYIKYVYYDLIRTYALWGKNVEAVQLFTEAIDNGLTDYTRMVHDTGFTELRRIPEFEEQLERIERYDYQTLLKQAKPYRKDKQRPEFTYQSPDAEELLNLRQEFKLDSIAGNGNEISQMKNIMTWLHNTVRHDGSHLPSCDRNASSLIAYAQKENRGINCWMLAVVLNECYLAMGWDSRYVRCFPQSSTDTDCHVINTVYSKTLDKWIWMDPSFNAWVTDENGSLLSIQEVRERAVKDQPLLINPDANWNHRTKYTKEMYLDLYMFKNLYWLECPAFSRYAVDTPQEGENTVIYVRLCPPGFYGFKPKEGEYVTNDPDYFWQKPQ